MSALEISILMPCLNEERTLGTCIKKALTFIRDHQLTGEVVVADNGSEDQSRSVAKQLGARVIDVQQKGYGAALNEGIKACSATYVIMGDSDDSYDFSDLMLFVEKLRMGYDLVIGNRFEGGIERGAMPFLHRYLGNPVLTLIGRLFFGSPVGDFHCGLRGLKRSEYYKLDLKSSGMEYASEMIVKATFRDLKICEVPTTLSRDGRNRRPHLNTWSDGWRHLRFLLMFSPRWLFLYPGLIFILVGFILSIRLISGPLEIGQLVLDVHSLLYFSGLTIIGFQFLFFFAFTKTYAVETGLLPVSRHFYKLYKYFNLERGLIAGLITLLTGLALTLVALSEWGSADFGELIPREELRQVIPGVTCLILGVQIILYSFFLSILGFKTRTATA